MRLGLFGGSFDPVHSGHLLVAQAALEELKLDRLIFIPAAVSPFKPGSIPASSAVRLRMLRISLVGRPEYTVDELEIRRGGVSYSVDTAREIQRRHPGANLLWLIGADHVAKLPAWRDAGELARLLEFVVIPRPGQPSGEFPPGFRLRELRGWPLRISSSEIRDRVRSGKPYAQLVAPGVAEIITAENLYQATG